MSRKNIILFFILSMVFIIFIPGNILAQEDQEQPIGHTITLKTPDQTATGQEITLVAQVREAEYDEPVSGVRVNFYVKTDFFISDLVDIGSAFTDNRGMAQLEYLPNQPGEIQIVASYKAGSDIKPVVAESTVIVSGETKPFYITSIGIGFPNSFFVWVVSIVLAICVVWGTFIFVISKVIIINISRGSGVKGAPIALLVLVSLLFILIIFILITQEPQYNFGFPPI